MENDRRISPRFACNGLAKIRISNEPPIPVHVLDLSAEGCHLLLEAPCSIGRDSEVVMTFEVDGVPFNTILTAKSIRSETSFGFRFPKMTEEVLIQLQSLVGLSGQLTPRLAPNRFPWEAAPATH
jgi:PilZ domain